MTSALEGLLESATSKSLYEAAAYYELIDADESLVGERDVEEIKAILMSFGHYHPEIYEILEISNVFQLSYELVAVLLDSIPEYSQRVDGTATSRHYMLNVDILQELVEISTTHPLLQLYPLLIDEGSNGIQNTSMQRVSTHTILWPSRAQCSKLENITEIGLDGKRAYHMINTGEEAGVKQLTLYSSTSRMHQQLLLVCSPTYSYCIAFDRLLDLLTWGRFQWSEGLEASILRLLVSVHEDLTPLIAKMEVMFKAMMPDVAEDLHKVITCAIKDVQLACNETHSQYAVGRLHQSLEQFLELQSQGLSMIFSIPTTMTAAIKEFIVQKITATASQETLKQAVICLLESAIKYRELLGRFGGDLFTSEIERLSNLIKHFQVKDQSAWLCDESDYIQLSNSKPQAAQTFLQRDGSSMHTPHSGVLKNHLKHMPALPLEVIQSPDLLNREVASLSQTLFGEIVQIGSLLGYSLQSRDIERSAGIINALLSAGLAYVTSETGKLTGLFAIQRSTVLINDPFTMTLIGAELNDLLPLQWKKRVKELARIFRTKAKKPFSLRCNTNLDAALALLRSHHGDDCWVGTALETVWRYMYSTSPPQLVVFELWYGDELIAADFGHPTNDFKTVYIATRCCKQNDAEIKLLQPGFICSMAACKVLREQVGCFIWDFGGVNECPLMKYKVELCGQPKERALALYEFQVVATRCVRKGELLTPGVLLRDLGVQDILGHQKTSS